MPKPDIQRQQKLLEIRIMEAKNYSFFEIVVRYNAMFGTHHFEDLLTTKEN